MPGLLVASAVAAALFRALRQRRIFRAFLRQRRLESAAMELLVKHERPLLVMSFGSICFTARSLGVAGGRTFAAPFDWIFSNPLIVADVISNGGATLCDKREYTKPPRVEDGSTGYCHRTYSPMLQADSTKTNKHGVVFSHHDPTIAEDHAYLQRAVCRLRAALASPLPKLCVLVSLENRKKVRGCDLETLHTTLEAHASPAGHVTLAVVKLTTQPPGASLAGTGLGEARHSETRLRNSTMRIVEMRCRGGLGPSALELVDPADRRDLLVAIFGPNATFDSTRKDAPDMLTSPLLAADPLSPAGADAAAAAVAAAAVPTSMRRQWCKGHNGRHVKYSSDEYMIERRGSEQPYEASESQTVPPEAPPQAPPQAVIDRGAAEARGADRTRRPTQHTCPPSRAPHPMTLLAVPLGPSP